MEPSVAASDLWPGSPFEALIRRCDNDRASHMLGGPCSELDLRAVEQALGLPLPPPLRLFLSRMGGGVFYLKHEVFGARRVMIHDIEIVPDILSFRAWLGPEVRPDVLPFHRADGRIHAMALGGDGSAVHVLGETEARYPDLTSFFRQVVVP